MNPLIKLKTIAPPLLIALALLCFGLLPRAQAVVPPPDGGYPNFTTAEGTKALQSLTTGSANTAVGWYSLFSDTTGNFNTGAGAGALALNTAENNTATGAAALLLNTTGHDNTANGGARLHSTIPATTTRLLGHSLSIAILGTKRALGASTLRLEIGRSLATPSAPTTRPTVIRRFISTPPASSTRPMVFLRFILTPPATRTRPTVFRRSRPTPPATSTRPMVILRSCTTPPAEATGRPTVRIALFGNTTGSFNTALGAEAGANLTTGDNNIDITAMVVSLMIRARSASAANLERQATFIAAIRGVTTGIADAVNVVIDSNGQLGTMSSSRRFKKDIEPMEAASEAILALKPVTFHYKSDQTSTPQFGLVAEDVAQVNPALVVHDKDGEIYTVRYDQVNAMLLNEFLKEHRKVQELQATVVEQKESFESKLVQQQKQLEALTAGLQKVSAQLELNKAAPQTVLNDN